MENVFAVFQPSKYTQSVWQKETADEYKEVARGGQDILRHCLDFGAYLEKGMH